MPMGVLPFLFSFRGRISRRPLWLFAAAVLMVMLLPAFAVFGAESEAADNWVTGAALVLLWPSLAVQAKRWHDRDKSAWWILIGLVPLIGFLWALIETGFLRGTPGANRFGPDPLAASRLPPSEESYHG